jgi:hypothetical protein
MSSSVFASKSNTGLAVVAACGIALASGFHGVRHVQGLRVQKRGCCTQGATMEDFKKTKLEDLKKKSIVNTDQLQDNGQESDNSDVPPVENFMDTKSKMAREGVEDPNGHFLAQREQKTPNIYETPTNPKLDKIMQDNEVLLKAYANAGYFPRKK